MENKILTEEKFKTQFVIIWKGHYFGCDFKNRIIKEIDFEEAFGSSFFDWSNNICIGSDWAKEQYMLARGEDGCGLTVFFNKRNDLRRFELYLIKQYKAERLKQKINE